MKTERLGCNIKPNVTFAVSQKCSLLMVHLPRRTINFAEANVKSQCPHTDRVMAVECLGETLSSYDDDKKLDEKDRLKKLDKRHRLFKYPVKYGRTDIWAETNLEDVKRQ